jgi:cytochrome b6-f complex iron-sulfur subunit
MMLEEKLMDRRIFIALMGTSALGVSLSAIARTRFSPSTAIAQPKGFQTVGQLSQLSSTGGSIQAKIGNTPVVVIRNPANSSQLLAYDRTCPHEGCKVNWQGDRHQFICPCHEAMFSATGSVTAPPARRPLTAYPVKVEGNAILVDVSSVASSGVRSSRPHHDEDDDERDDHREHEDDDD